MSKQLVALEDRLDHDALGLDDVDDPVVADDRFSDIVAIDLGNLATQVR
jgi:hypothetical protein